MSSSTLERDVPSPPASAELEALRAEVAELRRQVLEFEATRGAPVSPIAVSQLRARYEVLPPEAQALDAEAEAEACATFTGD